MVFDDEMLDEKDMHYVSKNHERQYISDILKIEIYMQIKYLIH